MGSYSIDEIITKAIGKKEDISSLYQELSRKVTEPSARTLLKELAKEELKHKEKLQEFQQKKKQVGLGTKGIEDPRISGFLEKPPVNKYAGAQEVLKSAIKEEDESHAFYLSWAESIHEEGAENILTILKKLAEEELGHKSKLEEEYKKMSSKKN